MQLVPPLSTMFRANNSRTPGENDCRHDPAHSPIPDCRIPISEGWNNASGTINRSFVSWSTCWLGSIFWPGFFHSKKGKSGNQLVSRGGNHIIGENEDFPKASGIHSAVLQVYIAEIEQNDLERRRERDNCTLLWFYSLSGNSPARSSVERKAFLSADSSAASRPHSRVAQRPVQHCRRRLGWSDLKKTLTDTWENEKPLSINSPVRVWRLISDGSRVERCLAKVQ